MERHLPPFLKTVLSTAISFSSIQICFLLVLNIKPKYCQRYLAPEVISSCGHGCSVDHWSLGILIYEMLVGQNPFYFDGINLIVLFQSILQDKPPPFSEGVSQEAQQIILNGLLNKDPSLHLGLLDQRESDILLHPWFRPLDLQGMHCRRSPAPWIPPVTNALDTSCFDDWSYAIDKTTRSQPKLPSKHVHAFDGFS